MVCLLPPCTCLLFCCCFFSPPLPPCCPLPCFLIEISLMHFFFYFNGLFCLPCFCLQSFFFFFTPLFLPLVPQEKRPPSRWDRMTVLLRVPSASSPQICTAFVLGLWRIWNGLLAASGRLMGNEVRKERGPGEVEGIAKGIWMPWCGKQIKRCT